MVPKQALGFREVEGGGVSYTSTSLKWVPQIYIYIYIFFFHFFFSKNQIFIQN